MKKFLSNRVVLNTIILFSVGLVEVKVPWEPMFLHSFWSEDIWTRYSYVSEGINNKRTTQLQSNWILENQQCEIQLFVNRTWISFCFQKAVIKRLFFKTNKNGDTNTYDYDSQIISDKSEFCFEKEILYFPDKDYERAVKKFFPEKKINIFKAWIKWLIYIKMRL